MALLTFGTNAPNTLSALVFNPAANISDVAQVAANIKNDLNPTRPIWPGAFSRRGFLFIPNRGMLRCLPGDYVAFGATGFPILVSAAEVAASYTSA